MWAAWEVGVWKAIHDSYRPDMVIGASAGAWIGWGIAGGATPDELAAQWLDPRTAGIMRLGIHSLGIVRLHRLCAGAQELYARLRAKSPFGLTSVYVPSLERLLV